MTTVEQDIEKMFKEIATSLKMEFNKTGFVRTESYNVGTTSFISLIDPAKGIIRFATRSSGSFGPYKKEELMSKAKREILVKLAEQSSKK